MLKSQIWQNANKHYSSCDASIRLKFCTKLPLNDPEGLQEPDFRFFFLVAQDEPRNAPLHAKKSEKSKYFKNEKKIENPAPGVPRD